MSSSPNRKNTMALSWTSKLTSKTMLRCSKSVLSGCTSWKKTWGQSTNYRICTNQVLRMKWHSTSLHGIVTWPAEQSKLNKVVSIRDPRDLRVICIEDTKQSQGHYLWLLPPSEPSVWVFKLWEAIQSSSSYKAVVLLHSYCIHEFLCFCIGRAEDVFLKVY